MDVYLIDGTYELFRHFFAIPSARNADGEEVAAVRGVLGSLVGMLERGATHLGVATDHVIRSFRNDLWAGYKDGAGVDPRLLTQFPLLEEAVAALGVPVWPMVEFEADDALASAACLAARDPSVDRVYVCTPDKDLAQCVYGDRVVQLDRRSGRVTDEGAVLAKFGVTPGSIPDYLALVGDKADGYPGLPGWGPASTAAVLRRWRHVDAIPAGSDDWEIALRGAEGLAATLTRHRDLAMLFRDLATLRTGAPLFDGVEELRWHGPTPGFAALCERLGAQTLAERVRGIRAARSASPCR